MKDNAPTYSPDTDCDIAMPVIFTLSDDIVANKLICKTVVRSLPGKRLVCLATWGGNEVFVKIFLDPRHARRHWQREHRGIKALLDGNVLTPPLLYSGTALTLSELAHDRTTYLVVSKRIAPATTLREAWGMADDKERRILLGSMMAVLATHHRAGLMHSDTHFENFLLQGKDIFTLDGDQVRVFDAPLDKRRSLHSLGLLFGQLTPDYDNCFDEVFPDYLKLRGWTECSLDNGILKAEINRTREYRKQKFLKKIFRTCSAFIYQKNTREVTVYDRNFDSVTMQRLIQDPDSFLNSATCNLLKRGNTATVGVIDIDGRALVIKRYNIKGRWHGFRRALQRSRAVISWRNAHLLTFYGIATPVPVALIEKRLGPLRRTSYFISSYVKGIDCARYFSGAELITAEQDGMADKLIKLFGQLAQARISHGDMKATNIIISDDGPVLIDIDAARQYATASNFYPAFARDIQRFLKNWDNNKVLRELFEQRLLKLLSDFRGHGAKKV